MDLINELVAIHGYRSYLEICTYTTGRLYGDLDRGPFTISHRLMYRCPEGYDDGLPIDFRSATSEIALGVTYELILVDPFHDYEQSLRDLRAARGLLAANRTIVVHDCRPPDRELASPVFLVGAWCGVTYKAYLDFMLEAAPVLHSRCRPWLRHHPPPASTGTRAGAAEEDPRSPAPAADGSSDGRIARHSRCRKLRHDGMEAGRR